MNDRKNYILRNATVIDPKNSVNEIRDLGIRDGVICSPDELHDPIEIDLTGLYVCPGLIDMHVHLRQPGGVEKETIKTGTMAAAAGGFTTIVAMGNTNPPADTTGAIDYLKRHSTTNAVVHVLPAGCITKGLAGEQMTGIGSLKRAGVVALSDDGKCLENNELMKHVIEYSKTFKLTVLDHCEDKFLSKDGLVHDGYWSAVNGLKGIPSASEAIMVARNIILAEATGGKIHIQHVSAKESVELVRNGREKGIQVSAEVTPHHIALTDECVKDFDTNFKMNPPLRTEEDRVKLIEGLQDNTISVIATDHAPHTETDKLKEFAYAPFGVIGLETALPVCLTELYHKGFLSFSDLVSKFTVGPAEVLGLDLGYIANGRSADLTIVDINKEHTVDADKFYSKSRNTPFNGMKLKGKAVGTVVSGRFVYSELDGVKGLI